MENLRRRTEQIPEMRGKKIENKETKTKKRVKRKKGNRAGRERGMENLRRTEQIPEMRGKKIENTETKTKKRRDKRRENLRRFGQIGFGLESSICLWFVLTQMHLLVHLRNTLAIS